MKSIGLHGIPSLNDVFMLMEGNSWVWIPNTPRTLDASLNIYFSFFGIIQKILRPVIYSFKVITLFLSVMETLYIFWLFVIYHPPNICLLSDLITKLCHHCPIYMELIYDKSACHLQANYVWVMDLFQKSLTGNIIICLSFIILANHYIVNEKLLMFGNC